MDDVFKLGPDYYRSPGEWTYEGYVLGGYNRKDIFECPDLVEYRVDDCFVVAYPKSGTTWTLELTQLIMNDGDPTFTESAHHNDRIPFLEYKYDEFPQWEGLGMLKKLKSPRLIKSHLPVSLFPKSALYKGCKVIYVARNPKDVVVSYYHFYKTTVEFGEYDGDFHNFLKQFMNGKVNYGDWFTYMLEWWKYVADNDILFLKYEDMKKDPRLATVKIANYLNRNLSDEVIDKITEYCSFKKMKKYMTNENNEGEYLRKGVIGDWKNYFTVAENEAFEKIYNERMDGSGLKFDW